MTEIWRLWSAVWLGLPMIQRKPFTLWEMPKKKKAVYTDKEKTVEHEGQVQKIVGAKNGFLNRQKEFGFVQEERRKTENINVGRTEKEYAVIQQPIFLKQQKENVGMEQAATLPEIEMHHKANQTIFTRMAEQDRKKETTIFSMIPKQGMEQNQTPLAKQKENEAVKQKVFLQQEEKHWKSEKRAEKQQNGKMLSKFLHVIAHENMMQQQTELAGKTSEIWKQQGEDVVMLQKILRQYENQQNGSTGNQNVSIQIGHIKQQADVDDVMEALTKKLWEARSITTKKAKGGV